MNISLLSKKQKIIGLLFLILIAGFLLRLAGIGYGLPFAFYPDETRQVLEALGMGQRLSPIPLEFAYPALQKYILLLAYGLYYGIGYLLKQFLNPSDFAFRFLINPTSFYFLGRLISVIFGTLIGLLAYLLGRRFFNKETGWVACLFTTFMYHLVQHSQWTLPDIILAFLSLLAFYYIYASLEPKNTKYFSLAGLVVGLAISTKHHGAFLLIPLLLSQFFNYLRERSDIPLYSFLKRLLPGLFLLLLGSLMGNLAWLFHFNQSWQRLVELSQVAKVGISSRATYSYNIFSLLAWFARELIRQETILGLLSLAGICYAIFKHTKKDLLFLGYLFFFFLAISNWAIRYLHLLISIFPIMCLFAARFITEFSNKLFKYQRQKILILVVSLVVAFPISDSIKANIRKSHSDTRVIAKDWIEKNIPSGVSVALDWDVFSPPLLGQMPIFLSDPKARDYYQNKMPRSIKERYQDFLKNKKVYDLVMLIQPKKDPVWPDDMPQEVIKKAEKSAICRRLYSHFNFLEVSQLRECGVKYVVLSSFSYSHFLLDDDPQKTELFNPYFKEDTRRNNKQAREYIDDSRHGLLFYLVRKARRYYKIFLNEEIPITLVKEIKPSGRNYGPVIKIYKLD